MLIFQKPPAKSYFDRKVDIGAHIALIGFASFGAIGGLLFSVACFAFYMFWGGITSMPNEMNPTADSEQKEISNLESQLFRLDYITIVLTVYVMGLQYGAVAWLTVFLLARGLALALHYATEGK